MPDVFDDTDFDTDASHLFELPPVAVLALTDPEKDQSFGERDMEDVWACDDFMDVNVSDIPDTDVHRSPEQTIMLPITSIITQGDDYCVFCQCHMSCKALIPAHIRYEVFADHRIWIPQNTFCCKGHVRNEELQPECHISLVDTTSTMKISTSELVQLLDCLREKSFVDASEKQPTSINFNESNMSDSSYYQGCHYVADPRKVASEKPLTKGCLHKG